MVLHSNYSIFQPRAYAYVRFLLFTELEDWIMFNNVVDKVLISIILKRGLLFLIYVHKFKILLMYEKLFIST